MLNINNLRLFLNFFKRNKAYLSKNIKIIKQYR